MLPTSERFFQDGILKALCISQFFVSFSFFGIVATLLFFLVNNIGLSQNLSYGLWGNFTSLTYISALIGGSLGGRYLSFRLSVAIGLAFSALGYFLITTHQQFQVIIIGLAFIGCGEGLIAPNLRNLLGIHYHNSSPQDRDNGFTFFHMANLGGQILGPISLPYLRLVSPILMFFVAGLSMLLGLLNLLINYKKIAMESNFFQVTVSKRPHPSTLQGILIILSLLVFTYVVLYTREVKIILEVSLFCVGIILTILLIRMEQIKRVKIIYVLLILGGLTVAEICYRQDMSIFLLFVDEHVNRKIFNIMIPASVFQALDPIFAILLFPFVVKIREKLGATGVYVTSGTSLSIGLVFVSTSFFILVLGILFATTSEKVSVILLIFCYASISLSELLILPIATAAVAEFSPIQWKGSLMGVLFLTTSLASYLAGWVGELISPTKGGHTSFLTYQKVFENMGIFSFICSIFLYFICSYWNKKYSNELKKNI